MKIILSRKGFDASFGGCASPIFEDGTFVSLPIPHWFKRPPVPAKPMRIDYADITCDRPIGSIVTSLTSKLPKPVKPNDPAHLDPDLRVEALDRKPGWRPLFGQADAAQGVLDRNRIGPGDIFLFFGWFRQVEPAGTEGQFRYVRGAPNIHMIFGWLQVGEVWRLGQGTIPIPDWAIPHPHAVSDYGKNNTIYVAAEDAKGIAAGVFPTKKDELVLTDPASSTKKSYWRLPRWFHPDGRRSCLGYHSNLGRWKRDENYAYLQSVAIGQEFVLDTDDYPEAVEWTHNLVGRNY